MTHPVIILERLITDRIMQATLAMTGRNRAGHGLVVASSLFALAGLGFLVFASHLWLTQHYAPDVAAFLTGLILIFVAALIAALAFSIFYFWQSDVRKVRKEIKKSIHEALEILDDFVADPVRQNPKTAALAASAAGFLLGEKAL